MDNTSSVKQGGRDMAATLVHPYSVDIGRDLTNLYCELSSTPFDVGDLIISSDMLAMRVVGLRQINDFFESYLVYTVSLIMHYSNQDISSLNRPGRLHRVMQAPTNVFQLPVTPDKCK